MCMLS